MTAPDRLAAEDLAARQFVQRNFRTPILLEAGAGTGKTTVLVNRILAWIVGDGWDSLDPNLPIGQRAATVLRGVVAVTFTEAAAASMHEKVVQGLGDLTQGVTPLGFDPELKESGTRADALLGRIEGLRITTIHSFCRRLLTAHSLAAGIHPEYRVDAEGEIRDRISRQVMEPWARRAYEGVGDPSALALARVGLGPEDILDALQRLVETGVHPEDFRDRSGDEGWEQLEERWFSILGEIQETFRRALFGTAPPKRMNKALSFYYLLGDLLHRREGNSPPNDLGLREGAETILDGYRPKLEEWGRGKFTQAEDRFLGETTSEITGRSSDLIRLSLFIRRLDSSHWNHARNILVPLLNEVRSELRRQGALSFDDLLRKAVSLLDSRELAARIRRGISQLLVDEFQDTSELQCRLIHRLAFEGKAEDRPGLFLVGDPKQSVYGWRNADLAAYDSFRQLLEKQGGQKLLLSVNFRSLRPILREVERDIEPIMRREEGVQPSFQPLFAFRGEGEVSEPSVEYWWAHHSEGQRASSALARRQEAKYLVKDLLRVSQEDDHWSWSNAAILLRTNTQLKELTEALQEAGIPYRLDRDRQYHQRREVIEALAFVRALLDPADQLSLLAVLRSSLVGVPDRVLEPLWTGGLPAGFHSLRPPDFPSERALQILIETVGEKYRGRVEIAEVHQWRHALLTFVTLMKNLRQSYASDPVDRFVDNLRRWTLVEAFEASRFLGSWRVANLQHFFSVLESRLEEGESAREVLRRLGRDFGENRDVEPKRPEGSKEALPILSIHRAKGLDFAHVYLLQIQAEVQGETHNGGTKVDRQGDDWSLQLMGVPEPSCWEAVERERTVRRAEAIRLLYVALTRAKNRVVISGRWNLEGKARTPKSFADLLQHRVNPEKVKSWLTQTTDLDFVRVDNDRVKWIALERATASSIDRDEDPSRAPVLSREEDSWLASLAANHQALEDRKELARQRQSRTLRGAASASAHHRLDEWLKTRGDLPPENDLPRPTLESEDQKVFFEVGSAIHEALEKLDLELDGREGEKQLYALADQYLERSMPLEAQAEAQDRVRKILQIFIQSPLWPRFRSLGPYVLGREVDILLPPKGEKEPLGALVGSVDLLYRDSATGSPVVVDYKTDRVRNEEDYQHRVEAYREQTMIYQLALQSALNLPFLPRAELWFLALGRWAE